jgi:DNA-binding transcriptional LysR family regulator
MKRNFTIARGDLDGLGAFLKVAEKGTFRSAAQELGVSPSALSQTIRSLEARVGVSLFSRTTRSIALTEAGMLLRRSAEPAFSALRAAFEAVQSYGDQPSGLLRINAPRGVLPFLLAPILDGYQKRHPKVEVELFAEDGFADIVKNGFDAGIRLGELLQPDMVAIPVSPPFRFAVAGSPAYLERSGAPKHPEDLNNHACIRARMATSGDIFRWEFRDSDHDLAISVSGPLIINDINTIIAAGLRGAGLIYVAEPVIAGHLARGDLVEVLTDFSASTPGMFLYYPSRTRMMPKLRAFIDFLRSPEGRSQLP